MEMKHAPALDRLAAETMLNVRAEAEHFAAQTGLPSSQVLADLMRIMESMLPKAVTNEKDKRASPYRVRLFIYQRGGLVADTDPEIDIGRPGTEVIRGLAAVGQWAREIVEGFHGQTAEGMSDAAIAKSIKSLRPSMSRNGGTHTWRFVYRVGEEECQAHIYVVSEPE